MCTLTLNDWLVYGVRIHYLDFIAYRAIAELKRDSSNMYLGVVWWILEPVLYMAVFYLVFGIGLKKGGLDFALYLLCGLVPWKWIDSTVRTASGIIVASPGLMRQIYFPKWILPGYIILANTYKFFIIFFLFVLLLLFCKVPVTVTWLALPMVMAVQLLFVSSLSLMASALVPILPDLKYAVQYGMTMLFFMSGIFFDVTELGEPVKTWLHWNPALVFIESFRSILLNESWPDWHVLQHVSGLSVSLFIFSSLLLYKLDAYYPRVVN